MTVTTTTNRAVFQGNGVTTEFDYDFKVLDETHLVVERRVAATGVVDKTYILTTEYTVSGIGEDAGSVTIIGTPLSSLYELVVTRTVPYTQELDLVNQGGFLPDTLEEQLDLTTMQIQQITTQLADDVAAAEAAAELAGLYLASISALGTSTTVFQTKALASAAAAGLEDGTAVWVLVDSSKNNTLSLYKVVAGGLLYQVSLSGTSDQSATPTGVLFDTEGADNFTDMDYTPDVSLTVGAGSIAFSSASLKEIVFSVLDPDGNPMRIASDNVTVDVTLTLTSFVTAGDPGTYLGFINDVMGTYGVGMDAAGGTNTQTVPNLQNADAILGNLSSGEAVATTVRVQYTRNENEVDTTFTFDADPDRTIATLTQVFDATSYELPRLFNIPSLRFDKGVSTVTKFKVSQGYPGAKYGFIGDSITQGRYCTAYADGFPQLARAAYPGEVCVYAAPSATTADWLDATYHVTEMGHSYAFVMLGTNDVSTAVPQATFETNYTNFMNELISHDVIPIALTIPPFNNANVPAFNTWIKAQGWRYIDIYPLLVGTGTALNPSYDSGDGLHPNTAGNLVIWNAIDDYITNEGL